MIPTDMCAKRRLKSACASTQSAQSLCCEHEETLHPWLSKMRPVKNLIRMRMRRLTWINAGRPYSKGHFPTFLLRKTMFLLKTLPYLEPLAFFNWIKNELIFYRISELMLATFIQKYDKNHFIFYPVQKRETNWNFTGCSKPYLWLY